jgi:hypothetical protein
MAIKNIVETQINVTGQDTVKQAADAYEDLGDAVSQTQLDAERLAQQFGINDKRTQEAIKVAGRYKQEMEELDFAIDAARGGSDQLFRAAQGVTAGFELAAGATALMGVESEELEKTLLKVQGAMVFSQGLKDLQEFAPAILNAATAIKTQLITAFTTLKGAIAATGIGAFIVGIGMLIDRISTYNNEINKTIDRELELARIRREEAIESLEAEERAFASATEFRLLQAQKEGASQEQLADLEIQLYTERKNALREFLNDSKTTQAERGKASRLYLEITDELYRKELQRDIAQNQKAKELAAERKKQREQEQKEREKEQQQKDKEQRLDNERQEQQRGQTLKTTETQVQSDKVVFDSASFLAKNEKQYTEQQIKNAEAEALAKEELYYLSQDLGNAVVTLLGEQTAAGKAVALAQVAADTARALSGALANANSPTPDNVASGGLAGIAKYIALATTIATNAKRAIDIVKSENVSGAASGSAPTTGGGFTGSFNAPTIRLPRREEFTGQQRIYVTEYDISNTQERVRVTEDVSIVK